MRALTRPPAVAWALFEFGYLAFAAVVFSRYLFPWLNHDLGNPDWYGTTTQLATAGVLIVSLPVAGALADAMGRRKPLLAAFVAATALAAALLGMLPTDQTVALYVVAALAGVFTSLAFAQYDPLLADATDQPHWGALSGVAVACGFAGAVASILLFTMAIGEGDKQRVFAPAGVILLAFTLPLLLLLRERPRTRAVACVDAGGGPPAPSLGAAVADTFRRLAGTGRLLRGHPEILRLLAGRFLYSDAVATVNNYLAVYLAYLGGFDERTTTLALVLAIGIALPSSLVAGAVVSRVGPRRPLLVVLPIYAAAIIGMGATGATWMVWVAAPLGGVSLGTIWTADRVFMLNLAPPAVRGEMFAFFNLVNRAAAAIAPFVLWGGIIFVLHDATGWLSRLDAARVSMVALGITALVGAAILRPLDDRPRGDVAAGGQRQITG